MLEFKPITLEDRPLMVPFLNREYFRACFQCFPTMYLWGHIYHSRFCVAEGWLFIKSGEQQSYGFPYGEGDLGRAIALLREDAHQNGKKLRFFGLLPEQRTQLEALFPGEFTYTPDRNGAEYLYEAEKLATYAGKKLHAKRNFCNRFESAHPDWQFVPITGENLEAVRQFHSEWVRENEGMDNGLHQEGCVVRSALRQMQELGLTGGALTAGGRIYGFSVGCMINGTVSDINIEKASAEEPGAYPMVCREMTRMMKEKYPRLTFVNREEDTGDEGLRRSKESYYPVALLEKYVTEER